jgi:hypothetical protein
MVFGSDRSPPICATPPKGSTWVIRNHSVRNSMSSVSSETEDISFGFKGVSDSAVLTRDGDTKPWPTTIEPLLQSWYADCQKRSVLHARNARHKKRMFRLFSIPSIIIPIAIASFSQLYSVCDDSHARVVVSIGYLMSSSLAGVGAFLNYGTQYAQHAQYEILYQEICNQIECILVTPVCHRRHSDVVLVDIRLSYDALNKGSPDL